MVSSFPAHYAGRVSTSSKPRGVQRYLRGAVGDREDCRPVAKTATGYASDGYTWAFGILFILQLAGLAWLALSRARPMARPHLVAGRLSAATRSRTS